MTADIGICDTLVLTRLVAQNAVLRGDGALKISAELERLWLEFAFLDDSGGTSVNRRVSVSGGVELTAALEHARHQLMRVEAEAATAVGNARAEVTKAQGRVDEFRVGLVREHAAAWREHAERLRQQAAEAGDATQVVSVAVQGSLDGARVEPRLEYLRNTLADEAAAADAKAAWLDGYLLRGDALDSQTLSGLVAEMVLPEAAETVAA